MISIRISNTLTNGLGIIALTREDLAAIVPYAKYSTYMVEKFAEARQYAPSHLRTLEMVDLDLRQELDVHVSRGWEVDVMRRRVASGKGYATHRVVTGRVEYFVFAITPTWTAGLAGLAVNVNSLCRRLQGRLMKVEFPPSGAYEMFVSALRGGFITCATTANAAEIQRLQTFTWHGIFPQFFRSPVDLKSWTAEVERVLGIFAKDRRTTVEKVKSLMKVKIV